MKRSTSSFYHSAINWHATNAKMFITQCPILWYVKVCALPSAHFSLTLCYWISRPLFCFPRRPLHRLPLFIDFPVFVFLGHNCRIEPPTASSAKEYRRFESDIVQAGIPVPPLSFPLSSRWEMQVVGRFQARPPFRTPHAGAELCQVSTLNKAPAAAQLWSQ